VARIARWEVSRGVSGVDRRTAVVGVVALILAGSVAATAVAGGGVALEEGLYRVGVDADSPYYEPVVGATALTARSPDATLGEGIDVRVTDDGVAVADGRKGEAALAAFRNAVRRYNDRVLAADDNRSAAFPVLVRLRYADRADPTLGGSPAGGGDAGPGGFGGDAGGGSDGPDGTAAGATGPGTGGGSGGGPLPVPDVGGGAGGIFGQEATGSPADIRPPFPFASLVLAFCFLIPMNFVIQAYGSTILNERINRRGELLLVAPIQPGDIVAGKTAPYLAAMLAVTVAIAVAVGGGPVAVAAVAPLAVLFLAATFVGAMFARSFKELTFVTVAVSTFLTTYAFVPAVFTDVTPIALISPLTLVVRDLKDVPVSAFQYAFSTGPVYLSAATLFVLGVGVYREEDMFTQRPVPLKLLDALDARLSGRGSVALVSALTIPFVFVAEALTLAVLFAIPVDVSIPLLLVAIATVEEVAKSLHVYAGYAKARFATGIGTAVVVGSLSGLGFFLGEKGTAIAQLVGLQDIRPLGEIAFATAGIGVGGAILLFLAPLALHATTAVASALGARKGPRWYLAGLTAAVLIHTTYNVGVVSTLG
jgi:ABC-type Na+ efflux pump permease subunit